MLLALPFAMQDRGHAIVESRLLDSETEAYEGTRQAELGQTAKIRMEGAGRMGMPAV